MGDPVPAVAGASPSESVGRTSCGLTLVASRHLDPRLPELVFQTPDLQAETAVRVLTPANMDPSGATRYPVLYLLHGATDTDASWTTSGNAEAITAGSQMIVVMP